MKRMINAEKFLDKLLYMGYMDEEKSEVEEVVNNMTEDAYSKDDVIDMLAEIQSEIKKMQSREDWCDYATDNCIDRYGVDAVIQLKINDLIKQKIDKLKSNENLVVEFDQCLQSFDTTNRNQRYYDKDNIWDCIVHSEINEIKHHIKVLENLLKDINGKIELYSNNKHIDLNKEKEIVETLGYAISSLKTDLKYVLMYDEEEIYSKADMISMLNDLNLQIEGSAAYNLEVAKIQRLIRDKINKLKKNTNDARRNAAKAKDKEINALKGKEMVTDFRINEKGELEGKVEIPQWDEMYNKDQVIDMLEDLKTEINEMSDSVVEGRTITIIS